MIISNLLRSLLRIFPIIWWSESKSDQQVKARFALNIRVNKFLIRKVYRKILLGLKLRDPRS